MLFATENAIGNIHKFIAAIVDANPKPMYEYRLVLHYSCPNKIAQKWELWQGSHKECCVALDAFIRMLNDFHKHKATSETEVLRYGDYLPKNHTHTKQDPIPVASELEPKRSWWRIW